MDDTVERGWDREDIDAFRKWGAQQVIAACGNNPPGVAALMKSVERRAASGYGPDSALIEAALHLPLEQFERVEAAVKRIKLNLPTRRHR